VCHSEEYSASNDICHAVNVALNCIAQMTCLCGMYFQQYSNEHADIPVRDLC
jgi:hypothetical protein